MNYFATSCTHFGHGNIISLAGRPFPNAKEMDEALIANWNSVVKPEDTIFHLGDVTWWNMEKTKDIFDKLKGIKIFIRGNHDDPWVSQVIPWSGCYDYLETKIFHKKFVFFHYPIERWNGIGKGTIHIHGHIHNNPLPVIENRHNVCVEVANYTPVNLEEFA